MLQHRVAQEHKQKMKEKVMCDFIELINYVTKQFCLLYTTAEHEEEKHDVNN